VNKVIVCPCGFMLRADSEPELVKRAQKHATDAHEMELTEEQALAMARPE
jgi:predicted small metal-binding protein